MLTYKHVAAVMTAATLSCAVVAGAAAQGAVTPAAEPWREPQDTTAAVFEPDRYAWRVFVALNWPASTLQKEADPTKPFGAPGPAVWETWRNVRPGASDTVFRPDGRDPGPWLTGATPVVARAESQFDRRPLKLEGLQTLPGRTGRPQIGPAFDPAVGNFHEVRLNLPTYEFIRTNALFNVEGQLAQVAAGKENLNFPPSSKEIKAVWRKIREADKPRYHWAEVTASSGAREAWGLTAIHISTKDVPNWFWTTFEHIDNKPAGSGTSDMPNIGWQTKSVDRFACPAPPHDCDKAPAGIGLQGTKWENYRLRGTQLDFVSSIGATTILGNSQIEAGFQATSSCVTCHAVAAIDRQGGRLGGFTPIVGVPQPEWFRDPATGQRLFMQLDFVFSLQRAARLNPP